MNEKAITDAIIKTDREINNLTNKRADYEKKFRYLAEQAPLPVGTLVRLKYNLDTDANKKLYPGWIDFAHYVNPTNPATIVNKVIYPDNVVQYIVRFDVMHTDYVGSTEVVFSPDQIQTEEEYLQAQERPQEISTELTAAFDLLNLNIEIAQLVKHIVDRLGEDCTADLLQLISRQLTTKSEIVDNCELIKENENLKGDLND